MKQATKFKILNWVQKILKYQPEINIKTEEFKVVELKVQHIVLKSIWEGNKNLIYRELVNEFTNEIIKNNLVIFDEKVTPLYSPYMEDKDKYIVEAKLSVVVKNK